MKRGMPVTVSAVIADDPYFGCMPDRYFALHPARTKLSNNINITVYPELS